MTSLFLLPRAPWAGYLHEDAFGRDAGLPRCDEGAKGHAVDRLVEVTVRKDRHRAIPAELGAVVRHVGTNLLRY